MTRYTAIALGLVVAALAAGCGEGSAIFNVDVYSFIRQDVDTIPYATLPAPAPAVVDTTTTPMEVTLLPGMGSATVESVTVSAAANILHEAGEGSLEVHIFFAADSDLTYVGTPQFTAASGPLGPLADTIPVTSSVTFTDNLFTQPSLWVGFRVRSTRTGAAGLQGKVAPTALDVRIVFQDNFP